MKCKASTVAFDLIQSSQAHCFARLRNKGFKNLRCFAWWFLVHWSSSQQPWMHDKHFIETAWSKLLVLLHRAAKNPVSWCTTVRVLWVNPTINQLIETGTHPITLIVSVLHCCWCANVFGVNSLAMNKSTTLNRKSWRGCCYDVISWVV